MKALSVLLMLFSFFILKEEVKAQQTITLDSRQAVQFALDSNLSVRASALNVEAKQAMKGASWDLPMTSVEGEYGQINSFTKDNSFSVSQSFSFPSLYINQSKLAEAEVQHSRSGLELAKLELASRVKQVYWQLVYLNSKKELLVYQDSLYAGFYRAAELRARTGETNKLEMITARSGSLEVRNRLQQVEADIGIYTRKLQTLLNTDAELLPTDLLLRRQEVAQVEDSSMLAANPSLDLMMKQVEISRLQKKIERSHMLPEFSIGYFSQTMQGMQEVDNVPRSFGPGDRFDGWQAGISIPLAFPSYTSKIKAAAIQEKVAMNRAGSFRRELRGQYGSLLQEMEKYGSSLDYYEKQALPEAELIISQAELSYKSGSMDYIDYILNLDRALQIKEHYLDELNNYKQTIVQIEFITGKIF